MLPIMLLRRSLLYLINVGADLLSGFFKGKSYLGSSLFSLDGFMPALHLVVALRVTGRGSHISHPGYLDKFFKGGVDSKRNWHSGRNFTI